MRGDFKHRRHQKKEYDHGFIRIYVEMLQAESNLIFYDGSKISRVI